MRIDNLISLVPTDTTDIKLLKLDQAIKKLEASYSQIGNAKIVTRSFLGSPEFIEAGYRWCIINNKAQTVEASDFSNIDDAKKLANRLTFKDSTHHVVRWHHYNETDEQIIDRIYGGEL
jgi:hypothetical protein